MRLAIRLFCIVWFVSATPALAQSIIDPDEGTLSSIKPRIPEPMVFDLVRPLGAHRGELEVNSLFRVSPGAHSRHVQWAPEVEYTFADGYGVEFELPMEGGRLDSLKVAVQGTLPGPKPRSFIQGWQGIWESAREGGAQVDLMYLAGARWHRNWSVFTMTGVRQERYSGVGHLFLGNYSLFFHAGRETTFGLESNLSGGGHAPARMMLMPQIHTRRSRYNVQGGAGLVREAGQNHFQIAWRISREF